MFPPCSQDSRLVLPLHGNCGGFGSRPLSPARQLLGGVTRRPTDQRDAMPAFTGSNVDDWAKLHHPRDLSQPLDDVGCDITDAYKLALGFPQPWPTPEGFSLPSPGSPASLPFQVQQIELTHRSCTPSFSHNEGNSGAFQNDGKSIREDRKDVHG
jgi:hypothetical protein